MFPPGGRGILTAKEILMKRTALYALAALGLSAGAAYAAAPEAVANAVEACCSFIMACCR